MAPPIPIPDSDPGCVTGPKNIPGGATGAYHAARNQDWPVNHKKHQRNDGTRLSQPLDQPTGPATLNPGLQSGVSWARAVTD